MKKYFKYFAFVGFLVGLLYGIGVFIDIFYNAPRFPGFFEFLANLLILITFGLLYSFYGILLWIICIGGEKLYRKFIKSS